MVPFLPLAVGATVAGMGFAVGKRLTDAFLIPWAIKVANNWSRSWKEFADANRKRRPHEEKSSNK